MAPVPLYRLKDMNQFSDNDQKLIRAFNAFSGKELTPQQELEFLAVTRPLQTLPSAENSAQQGDLKLIQAFIAFGGHHLTLVEEEAFLNCTRALPGMAKDVKELHQGALSDTEMKLIRAFVAHEMNVEQRAALMAIAEKKPELQRELNRQLEAHNRKLLKKIQQEDKTIYPDVKINLYHKLILRPWVKFWYVDLYHFKNYLTHLFNQIARPNQ